MRDDHDSDDQLKRAFRDAGLCQDFADLQNELQGLETGRMARFLSAEERDRRKLGDESRVRERDMSRLQHLLAMNSAYATAYDATWNALEEAEDKTMAALAALTRTAAADNERLQAVLDTAARLPDGTRVFRDTDGTVWTEHGRQLEPEAAQSIVWTGIEPSYEEFRAVQDAVGETEAAILEIERYQVDVLGHARDRLTDEDNPPELEELEEIQRRIVEEWPTSVPTQVMSSDASVSTAPSPTTLDIPKL